MILWKYIIKTNVGTIITKNCKYAEMKSKQGCRVFCKRERNIYKFYH
jgi:hypothetical protein